MDHDARPEIEALNGCQGHDNIVKKIEHMKDGIFSYIVFEFLSGGELYSRIHRSVLSEQTAHSYFRQILDGVSYIHSRAIVHRDLKPENIMFVSKEENAQLKIVDFGFARLTNSEATQPCFTLDYAAPETLTKGSPKETGDLWSLGAILYTMLVGHTPFMPADLNKQNEEKKYRDSLTDKIRRGSFNTLSETWNKLSDAAKDLITKLMQTKESDRLTLKQVSKHRWITKQEENRRDVPTRESGYNEQNFSDPETITIDDDSNGIPSNDEVESHQKVCSNDSSGIVLSDRNEGSSISSREEIEDSTELHRKPHDQHYNNGKESPVNVHKGSNGVEITALENDQLMSNFKVNGEEDVPRANIRNQSSSEKEPLHGFENPKVESVGLWAELLRRPIEIPLQQYYVIPTVQHGKDICSALNIHAGETLEVKMPPRKRKARKTAVKSEPEFVRVTRAGFIAKSELEGTVEPVFIIEGGSHRKIPKEERPIHPIMHIKTAKIAESVRKSKRMIKTEPRDRSLIVIESTKHKVKPPINPINAEEYLGCEPPTKRARGRPAKVKQTNAPSMDSKSVTSDNPKPMDPPALRTFYLCKAILGQPIRSESMIIERHSYLPNLPKPS